MSLTRVWSANTSRMYSAGARCSIACPSLPRCSRSIARSLLHHFKAWLQWEMRLRSELSQSLQNDPFSSFQAYLSPACPTNATPNPYPELPSVAAQGIFVTSPLTTSRASQQSSIPRLFIISHSETIRPDHCRVNSAFAYVYPTNRTITRAHTEFDTILIIMLSRPPR
jgi:hypothetical protein